MNGYGAVVDPEDTNVVKQHPQYFGTYGLSGSVPKDTEEMRETGRKFDSGKLQYGLLPPKALKEVVKVLTIGAVKYDKNNWQKVPDAQYRYYDALHRHLWDWFEGQQYDPETGINHLAHAMCNLLFLLERDLHTEEEWVEIVKKTKFEKQ